MTGHNKGIVTAVLEKVLPNEVQGVLKENQTQSVCIYKKGERIKAKKKERN